MTLAIPHPYADGLAEPWISTHAAGYADGKLANFAIVLAADGALIGSIDQYGLLRSEWERS